MWSAFIDELTRPANLAVTEKQKEDIINSYILINGVNNNNPYGSPAYMVNFKTDLVNADPLTTKEDITLIPLYNDTVPIFSALDFPLDFGTTKDRFDLFDELENKGYIEELGDATYYGALTKKFYDLIDQGSRSIDDLDPKYESIKEEIFTFLFNLNRSKSDDRADKARDGIGWLFQTKRIAKEILGTLD